MAAPQIGQHDKVLKAIKKIHEEAGIKSGVWVTPLAVLIVGIAASGHQAWSANIFTTVSDMFPKKAVGSVTGIGGMAGAFGGLLIAKLAGLLFDHYKNIGNIQAGYFIMFIICGCAYLTAWLVMHFLVPSSRRTIVNNF